MKSKLMILCICFIFIISCEKGEREEFFDLKANKISELEFKLNKETGTIVSYYQNGNKKASVTMKNGNSYLIEEWFENGKKKRKKEYTESYSDWKETTWYENGQKEKEKEIKDNTDHGKEIWWYENGHKRSERNYIEGKSHGKWLFWDKNGQLEAIMEFKNGKLTRSAIFENGKMVSDKYPEKEKTK